MSGGEESRERLFDAARSLSVPQSIMFIIFILFSTGGAGHFLIESFGSRTSDLEVKLDTTLSELNRTISKLNETMERTRCEVQAAREGFDFRECWLPTFEMSGE